MRRFTIIFGLMLSGTTALLAPVPAQDVIPAAHSFSRHQPACDEPQRIVVKLPPPQVEVCDRCSASDTSPARRWCLFGHRHKEKTESHRHAAPVADVFWAPASLPAMIVQGAAPQAAATHTQTITHDFSALRLAQDMEMQAAAMGAHLAARTALINHESDALRRAVDRHRASMDAMSLPAVSSAPAAAASAAAAAAEKDKSDAKKVTLEQALKNVNQRLDQIEELVLKHHEAIDALRKGQGQKPTP